MQEIEFPKPRYWELTSRGRGTNLSILGCIGDPSGASWACAPRNSPIWRFDTNREISTSGVYNTKDNSFDVPTTQSERQYCCFARFITSIWNHEENETVLDCMEFRARLDEHVGFLFWDNLEAVWHSTGKSLGNEDISDQIRSVFTFSF